MNSVRGRQSVFFVKDLGLALALKMCPEQSQALNEVNNSQAFTVGRKKWPIVFSGRAGSRCSKACLYKVSRKYSKNWLRRTNIKSIWTPRIKYTQKPSIYDAKSWFSPFTVPKSNAHSSLEIDLEIVRTCLMCSCRAFYECVFLFSFFFRWKCGIS